MLVLTRRPSAGDRSILCIGEAITVTVLAIRGELVELAVSAPAGVSIETGATRNTRPFIRPKAGHRVAG